jgi:LysM repeat protein
VATRTYTVKSGDTLSGIAARFGVTWQAIAKLNGIKDPRTIRTGMVLKIP